MYRQSEKNLLSSDTSSTCPDNMVNFGLLTAEIGSRVWGTHANFNGFRVLAALLHGILVMAALCNRGAIIFLPCSFFLLSSSSIFFPRLISEAVSDVCHTSTHGVALVRI